MNDAYGISRRRLIGEAWFWIAIFLVTAFVLIMGSLGWRYVIAGPKGAVGAKEQQQNAINRVQKQEQFEQIAADYRGYLVKLKIAQAALAATTDPIDKGLRQTELIGLRQTCVDAAQQFNAESRKYTSRVWKSAGLPARLDPERCV